MHSFVQTEGSEEGFVQENQDCVALVKLGCLRLDCV